MEGNADADIFMHVWRLLNHLYHHSDRMLAQLGISDHRPTDTANFAGSRR